MPRYQVAAENFSKGTVNDPSYTYYTSGVATKTDSLRELSFRLVFDLKLMSISAVYPECVSSTVNNDDDPNDPETRWFAQGDYASCQHRSYACSLRQGRRNVLDNVSTPPAAAVAVESDVEMEDARDSQ